MLDNPAFEIAWRRPPLVEVHGEIAIDQVRQWLSACQQSHTHCEQLEDTLLPSRLIDVAPNGDGSKVKLFSSKGQYGSYIALSYCWGTMYQPTTVRANLAEREAGIPVKTLPQTIQDAIAFTRELGIRFLWIDTFCIIQDDDADRIFQIANMGNIFKNSYLTVAASTAYSVYDGFLQNRDKRKLTVKLPVYVSPSTRGSVSVTLYKSHNWHEEPLQRRGWALQEALLSSRMLHFGAHEIVWQCSTDKWLPPRSSPILYENVAVRLPQRSFNSHLLELQEISSNQLHIWHRIVEDYSARSLTIPDDRVHALVGIVKELSRQWQDTCIIGLWSRTFIQDLMWCCPRPSSRYPIANVPSWSWLSIDSRVHYSSHVTVDASLIISSQGMREITTIEDLDKKSTVISLRARTLLATDFLRLPARNERIRVSGPSWSDEFNEDLRLSCDINLSRSLTPVIVSDCLLALLGFRNSGSICLLLRRYGAPSPLTDVWERVGRVDIGAAQFDWSKIAHSSILIK